MTIPPGMVAVPCEQQMWTRAVQALLGVALQLPNGSRLIVQPDVNHSIRRMRNWIVEQFLEAPRELEWLLFLDSDMAPPADVIDRLYHHDVDVAGALYYSRHEPYLAELYPLEPLQHDRIRGLLEVEAIGFGCVMIRRRVLERLGPHCFSAADAIAAEKNTDDIDFCRRARAAGFRIWADCDVDVAHIAGNVGVDRQHSQSWQRTPRGEHQARAHIQNVPLFRNHPQP